MSDQEGGQPERLTAAAKIMKLREEQFERLTASANRIAQLREELGVEQSRRDELIITLRDAGQPWRQVARAARLSISTTVAIVNAGA